MKMMRMRKIEMKNMGVKPIGKEWRERGGRNKDGKSMMMRR